MPQLGCSSHTHEKKMFMHVQLMHANKYLVPGNITLLKVSQNSITKNQNFGLGKESKEDLFALQGTFEVNSNNLIKFYLKDLGEFLEIFRHE